MRLLTYRLCCNVAQPVAIAIAVLLAYQCCSISYTNAVEIHSRCVMSSYWSDWSSPTISCLVNPLWFSQTSINGKSIYMR